MMSLFLVLLSALFCVALCTAVPKTKSTRASTVLGGQNYDSISTEDGFMESFRIPVRSIPPFPKGPKMTNKLL